MKPSIRCSQLDQLFECPGSWTIQQIVGSLDRDASHEGSYLHWAIASRLIGELGATPPEGGLPLPRVPAGYKAPTRSDWIADFCFNFAKQSIPTDWAMEVETPLAYEFDRFILTGHPDLLGVNSDATESEGDDWKTGYNAVDPAESNNQALGYIVLQKRAYPTLRKSRFSMVQPRACEEDGEQRVSTVVVEGEALNDAVEYLNRKVNDALDHIDIINSGPRQCRWCSAAPQCPAIWAELEAMKMYLTPELLATIKREPNDTMLADLVVSARIVDQPVKDAKEMLHERLAQTGGSVTSSSGVTITQSEQAGQYSVTAPVPLYQTLCATLPPHEVAKVVDPSVTRLKDAIARVLNVPKTGKAAVTAESVFAERFRPHMEQGKRRIFKFS